MSKRILVITGGTYIAGTEIVTLDVLRGLKRAGWPLHCIISGWNNGDFPMRLEKLGISYSTIKLGWYYIRKLAWSLDSFIHYPRAIIKFLYLRKKHPHDFLYINSYRQLILLYPFIRKNVVYHVHDPNRFSRQSAFFLKIADRKILKYIAVSQFIRDDLLECGISGDKIVVIHNSVDPEQFDMIHAEKRNGAKIVLGIVGQVIPRKGHDEAIAAFSLLVKKGYKNITLYIIGTGDQAFEKKLKAVSKLAGIEEDIVWKGFVKEKEEIYKDIDILLAPTRNKEPFGMMAIEANLLGIPVIASNQGGLLEIIEHGYNGYLIHPNNAADLAQKIELFLQNNNLITVLGSNGRQRIMERFSYNKMIDKFSHVFDSL